MDENYKILLVEDVPSDADLAEREIRKIIPNAVLSLVDTEKDFINALEEFKPVIIISDYQMPTFDGMSALKIAIEKAPLVPFIIFTGSMNEDIAVDCMKAGATDYVIKEDFRRLGPAIKRALEIKSIKQDNLAAHKALIESENRFRRIAENANDLIFRYEFLPVRRFAYVSPSATAITGYTPEDHYNDPDLGFKMVHPEDRHFLDEIILKPQELNKTHTIRFIRKDGGITWIELKSVPIFNDNGDLYAIEVIARDITKRKLAEEATIQNEQRFRKLLDAANNISVQGFDKNGIIHYWNKASERIYGYIQDEALGQNITDLIFPPEMRNEVGKRIRLMTENNEVIPAEELLLMKKGGEIIPVLSNRVVVSYSGKEPELYSIDVDLTERNKAIEQLRLNEARLRSLVRILQSPTTSDEQYLNKVLNEALELTESKFGYIYTYNEGTKEFKINSWSDDIITNYGFEKPQDSYELDSAGLWGEAIQQRKAIIINGFKVDNPQKKGFPEGDIILEKFLALPIIIGEKIVAVIGVANKATKYQESDVLQLTLLMNSAWKALEKKQNEYEIQLLSTATEQSPVSVIITDTKGVIQFVNKKFIQSTHHTREELHGRVLRVFKPENKSPDQYRNIMNNLQLGLLYKGELKNIKDNGEIYWEWVNISPIRDTNGAIINYVILSEDITSRKQMEADLVSAKEKAEENDRLKTSFLNNLSHEIRTPLNSIVGYSQLINTNEPDSVNIKKYSEIIQQGSQQLLSIMDNIIRMSVIEAGQLKIDKIKSNLNKLLNIVYNQLKYKADQKNILLQSNALFSLYEADVIIDEIKVIQVLTNLVENAIKYTDSGFVKFGCSVTAKEIQFFVEDSGFGIPDNMKDAIFERFRQGPSRPGIIQEGLGLGLAIAKFYVEIMGGELKLKSIENKGSKFTFAIPYKASIVETVSLKSTNDLYMISHKTILVVDDVEVNHYLILEILSDLDITVLYSSNGKEAIEMVAGKPEIDLVLMDVKMPEMDGYTATKEIKKIRPELPVIAQTAYALTGDRQKSIEHGCDDYISKPIMRQSLLVILKKYLEKPS